MAKVLKHDFDLDMTHSPNCGGQRKIIAAVLAAAVIWLILMHLGLRAREPSPALARGGIEQAA